MKVHNVLFSVNDGSLSWRKIVDVKPASFD